jgi:hypothetical protein
MRVRGTVVSGFGAVYFAYLVMLRLRMKRSAAVMS